jgi:putative hemolysin
MKRFAVMLLVVAGIAGCASNPGVVKTGPSTYMVSRQGKTGFAGIAGLRAKAMNDANTFCAKQGKQAQMTGTSQSSGLPILGNFPRADIEFTCVPMGSN